MHNKKNKSGGLVLNTFRFRDKEISNKITNRLKQMELEIRLMHICGTHQDTIVRYGLDSLLKESGVEVRAGPGCPVCVTTSTEYEEAIALAREGKTIVTYGDASLVPGYSGSLLDLRAEGFDVRIVYSISDAVKLAKKVKKDVVFLAIGFETTAPTTAATLLSDPPQNFSVLSCHRYIPPVLTSLVEMGEVKFHGLIEPGHVSTIIGVKPYEKFSERYNVPQVIAGFEPLDVLMAVFMLAQQIKNNEAKVENEYIRSVRYEGNSKALSLMSKVFEPMDLVWRGFSTIPDSGMKIRREFQEYDARVLYEDELTSVYKKRVKEPIGCRCTEVLRGLIESQECTLFGGLCRPEHPVGPCMVSMEGSCNIEFKYGSL